MSQLDLTAQTLIDYGFKQKIMSQEACYVKKTENGYFLFNPLEKEYRWYHVTKIGDHVNHLHLNIQSIKEFEITLKVFRIETSTNQKEAEKALSLETLKEAKTGTAKPVSEMIEDFYNESMPSGCFDCQGRLIAKTKENEK